MKEYNFIMVNDGLTLLSSGLWLIPLFMLLVLVGLYLWIRAQQHQSNDVLSRIMPRLNRVQGEVRLLDHLSRGLSGVEREPFKSKRAELLKRLEEIDEPALQVKQEYVALQKQARIYQLSAWKLFIGGPFYWYEWYRIRRDAQQLYSNVIILEERLNDAKGLSESIQTQGWIVAEQARALMETEQIVRMLVDRLGDHKLYGDAFESAASQEEQLIAALDQIPPYFLSSDQQEVLSRASTDVIADVHEIIERTRPGLETLLARLHTWDDLYKKITEKIAHMRQSLDSVRQIVDGMPPELDVSSESDALAASETIAAALQATLSRLEIESISAVEKEAIRIEQSAADARSALTQARRQLSGLFSILDNLLETQKAISEIISQLGKHPVFPVKWGETQNQFARLNRQVAEIGPINQRRSIETLGKHLELAQTILSPQRMLYEHCKDLAEKHTELLQLLSNPELQGAISFLEDTHPLLGRVSEFAAENWPRVDSIETLSADLSTFELQYRAEIPTDLSSGMAEEHLALALDRVRELVRRLAGLQDRAEHIRKQLETIQSTEQDALDRIQSSRIVFSQISGLVSSNDFLRSITESDILRLRNMLEQRKADLSQRKQGVVDKKASTVNNLLQMLETTVNSWLEQLNQEIERKKKQLADTLDRLQAIANVEDADIDRAQRLLAQDLQVSVIGKKRPTVHYELHDLLGQLKSRNDYWQECDIALRKLNEGVLIPLDDAYRQALQQRQQVQELLQKAGGLFSAWRGWPPTSVVLDSEQQELNLIENQFVALKSQNGRAIQIVRRYDELGNRYRGLGERLRQAANRVSEEADKIRELEEEIQALLQRWQKVEKLFPTQPGIPAQVRSLRLKTTARLEEIKQTWSASARSSTGSVSYDQVLRMFYDLIRDLEKEVLVVGDEQSGWKEINIDGSSRSVRNPDAR